MCNTVLRACAHTHMETHMCSPTRPHALTHAYSHTHAHTQNTTTRSQTHAHTHAHMYTHTHAPDPSGPCRHFSLEDASFWGLSGAQGPWDVQASLGVRHRARSSSHERLRHAQSVCLPCNAPAPGRKPLPGLLSALASLRSVGQRILPGAPETHSQPCCIQTAPGPKR